MLRVAKELHCDFCSVSIRLDSQTLTEEWPALRRDGWGRGGGGRHLCPECNRKAYLLRRMGEEKDTRAPRKTK